MSRSFSKSAEIFRCQGPWEVCFCFSFLIYIDLAAEAVGTVGNSERLGRRVFQALWERWKNRCLFFHRSHRAAVSTAWAPQWPGGAAGGFFRSLTARETDCYSWHGTETVTLD